MARKNKMYEKMYSQLVKECNELEDLMKVKIVTIPDTLTIDTFKELAANINSSMEKLVSYENAKVTPEFRKIYSKLADSLTVIETRVSNMEREIADAKRFESIDNFETAVSNMLVRKATIKEAIELKKKISEKQSENDSEKQPENDSEKQSENIGYTDIVNDGKVEPSPDKVKEKKQEVNRKFGNKKGEIE
jgi:hypothetical protein